MTQGGVFCAAFVVECAGDAQNPRQVVHAVNGSAKNTCAAPNNADKILVSLNAVFAIVGGNDELVQAMNKILVNSGAVITNDSNADIVVNIK